MKNPVSFLLLSVFGFISILIWLGTNPLTYDEPWYLSSVHLIRQYGLSSEFLRNLPGPAGPLYPVIHYLLEPITKLEPPAVRWINPLLTLITLYSLFWILRAQKTEHAGIKACSLLAIPMVWTSSGLALTEIPALCAYTIHLCFLFMALSYRSYHRILWALLSGLMLGLSILGRQPLLLVLFCFIIWGYSSKAARIVLITTSISALLIFLPVFFIWRGLVPPQTSTVARGFSFNHLWIGLSYSAILFIIICPRWLILKRSIWIPILLASVLLNFLLDGESILPMTRLSSPLFSPELRSFFGKVFIGVFRGVGLVFFLSCLSNAYHNRRNPIPLFFLTVLLSQILSMAAVAHQASSRYLLTAAPSFVLLASSYRRDKFILYRFTLGACLGALLLIAHLGFHPLKS